MRSSDYSSSAELPPQSSDTLGNAQKFIVPPIFDVPQTTHAAFKDTEQLFSREVGKVRLIMEAAD